MHVLMLAQWTLYSALLVTPEEREGLPTEDRGHRPLLSNTQRPTHCPAGWKSWVWTLYRWNEIEPSSSIEWLDITQQKQQLSKSWCLFFIFIPFNGARMLCSYPETSVFSCIFYREPQCFFQDSMFHLDSFLQWILLLVFFFCVFLSKKQPQSWNELNEKVDKHHNLKSLPC